MPNKIKVMTFNTYLLHVPLFSIGASTRNTRINAMIRDNIFSDVDIVIFQEVFSQDSEKKLFSGMRELGVIYHTPVAAQYNESILAYCDSNNCWNNKKGTWDIIQQVNSGIAIASRYPIIYREYHLFDDSGCGADRFSAKGGVRAVIDFKGSKVNVIGTHMQSDDHYCIMTTPSDHRKTQLNQLINWANSIASEENLAVVLGGDLNINYTQREYIQALDIIGWGEPEYVSSTPSWDVTSNDIIKAAHPDEKESWHLDYIFAKNVASIKEQTRQVKMKTAYYYNNNNAYYDYSDHYPVVAEIEL
ncbi:sphingomyelin phosphodiesterase [Providencia vermicola]|uniref:sphingomyelin phosphodiesterase n=1 Tax=Providencia vermicola TaxID=333965 RepID=UPI0021500544|nr:sphingomyelin phosphodiesterase [Providencia vermicola]